MTISSSLDKSGSSSRTETEDKVNLQNKTRLISSASLGNKDTKEQQPKEIIVRNEKLMSDNPIVSIVSVHRSSITTVFPEKNCISREIKKRNLHKFRSQVIKLLKNQTTQVKKQKLIVALMKQNLF